VKKALLIIGILIPAVLISIFTIDKGHDWGGDFALYISQAKAILSGTTQHLFLENSYSMDNSAWVFGPDLYPPGYPLILCLIIPFTGVNFMAFKIINILFYLAFLIFFYETLHTKTNALFSSYFTLALSLCYPIIYYTDMVLSDIPFLFFCYLFLHLASSEKQSTLNIILAGIILGFSSLIRSAGYSLFIAYALYLFLIFIQFIYKKRDFKFFLQKVSVLLMAGLVFLPGVLIYPTGSYAQDFHIGIQTITENLIYYHHQLLKFTYWEPLSFLFIAIFLLGLIKHFKRSPLISLWVISYLSILFFYPNFETETRILMPLFPAMIFYIAIAVFEIKKLIIKRIGIVLFAAFIIFSGINNFHDAYKDYKAKSTDEICNSMSKDVFDFVKNNTPENAIIAFFKPRVLRLMTGRNAIALFEIKEILNSKADYYIDASWAGNTINHEKFTLIYQTDRARIYKILR